MSHDLNDKELEILRTWSTFNDRIIKFQYKADLFKFQQIFGAEEGERLFRHFRFDCNHQYQKFITYLVVDQYNKLLITILRDPRYSN